MISFLILALVARLEVTSSRSEPTTGLPQLIDSLRGRAATLPVSLLNNSTLRDVGETLALCDCEKATGGPYRLSCDKQGYFLAGFEREGNWVAGGGIVPLSRAICCRPCLPKSLPKDPNGVIASDDKALSIVSLGCHRSTNRPVDRLKCEDSGSALVAGFSEAVPVGARPPETFYPVNSVGCCTPALLMQSGASWAIERCNCHQAPGVNCGAADDNRLLFGFMLFRVSPFASFVPIAPAQCCQLCLSERTHAADGCQGLNGCSGHGQCVLGGCECFGGWTSDDCSQPVSFDSALPGWVVVLIVVGCCCCMSMFMLLLGRLVSYVREREERLDAEREGGDGSDLAEQLLLRLDADDAGSVGSQDTTDDEEEDDDTEDDTVEDALRGGRWPRRERGRGGRAGSGGGYDVEDESALLEEVPLDDEDGVDSGGGEDGAGAQVAGGQRRRRRHPQLQGMPGEIAAVGQVEEEEAGLGRPLSQAPATDAVGVGSKQQHGLPVGPTAELVPGENGEKQVSGPPRLLTGADCSVCLYRPVQVVIVPCGHACMCRKCSRRVARCPVCRKDIARRQRLFVGG